MTEPPREPEAVLDCGGTRLVLSSRPECQSTVPPRPARALTSAPSANARQRLERDLHDGVQNELVALIVKLALVQEAPEAPTGLVETLAGLEAHAQAALDAVRAIVRGIYPPFLAQFGVERALSAQAARAPIDVSLKGTAPRSGEAAEETLYFACSEAIQNAAKHAGRGSRVTLRFRHSHGLLVVQIADDGRGFDPLHTPSGAGLQNIGERLVELGGTCKVTSRVGHGTVLTISIPWPAATDGSQ